MELELKTISISRDNVNSIPESYTKIFAENLYEFIDLNKLN